MRVYLDYQIWDYISKNDDIKKYFEKQKVDKKWSYYISVAHIEELYKAQKNESIAKAGITDSLKKTIRSMAENGVIMPTTQGVRYMPGSFQMASFNVMFFDTTDIVEKRSLFRKLLDNNAYNPQKLFEGIKHDKNNEYITVWETARVQKELSQLPLYTEKLKQALLLPGNSYVKDMEKKYGPENTEEILSDFLDSLDVEIKSSIYSEVKNDYRKLEYVIECLDFILTKCGFKRDGSDKHAISGTYDIQHSICATMCDIFITNDERFADKFKAVAYYLDIPIQIIKWQDIDI